MASEQDRPETDSDDWLSGGSFPDPDAELTLLAQLIRHELREAGIDRQIAEATFDLYRRQFETDWREAAENVARAIAREAAQEAAASALADWRMAQPRPFTADDIFASPGFEAAVGKVVESRLSQSAAVSVAGNQVATTQGESADAVEPTSFDSEAVGSTGQSNPSGPGGASQVDGDTTGGQDPSRGWFASWWPRFAPKATEGGAGSSKSVPSKTSASLWLWAAASCAFVVAAALLFHHVGPLLTAAPVAEPERGAATDNGSGSTGPPDDAWNWLRNSVVSSANFAPGSLCRPPSNGSQADTVGQQTCTFAQRVIEQDAALSTFLLVLVAEDYTVQTGSSPTPCLDPERARTLKQSLFQAGQDPATTVSPEVVQSARQDLAEALTASGCVQDPPGDIIRQLAQNPEAELTAGSLEQLLVSWQSQQP